MNDILLRFPIAASPSEIFKAITTPSGLDCWWTLSADGIAIPNAIMQFGFGPNYQWQARVSKFELDRLVEYTWIVADDDWTGTKLRFELVAGNAECQIEFAHTGWKSANDHFRTSGYCWSMYLRLLKQYVETGKTVPYARRLDD